MDEDLKILENLLDQLDEEQKELQRKEAKYVEKKTKAEEMAALYAKNQMEEHKFLDASDAFRKATIKFQEEFGELEKLKLEVNQYDKGIINALQNRCTFQHILIQRNTAKLEVKKDIGE